jgi:hypothetical protein
MRTRRSAELADLAGPVPSSHPRSTPRGERSRRGANRSKLQNGRDSASHVTRALLPVLRGVCTQ